MVIDPAGSVDQIQIVKNEFDNIGNSNSCGYFTGKDCVTKFIQMIQEIQRNKQFTLCAYNGSSFDSFILYEYC